VKKYRKVWALIKNWNRDDLLLLSLVLKMNWQIMHKTVNEFDSLSDMLSSPYLPSYLSDKSKENSLFPANTDEEKAKAEQQISICKENNFEILTFWDDKYPNLAEGDTSSSLYIIHFGKYEQPGLLLDIYCWDTPEHDVWKDNS
jgi:hypothetical protein